MAFIPVDSGVTLPSSARPWGAFDTSVFSRMRVGDSFGLPVSPCGKFVLLSGGARVQHSTLRVHAYQYGKRLGRRFSVRRVGDEYRCWRTG